jgi:predicted GNAT superfamily acetyltransferase
MTDVAERSAHDPVADTRSGGILIRDCATLEEYLECVAIQEETWGRGFSECVPAAILRVAQRVGGVTAAAFDAHGRMLGFVFGITGVQGSRLVHWSDMLAVRPEVRGRHIGEQLKQYQRDKVRALGVRTILWTFDPLVARNAHFNINRLGAMPVEYAVNLYGTTRSALHGMLPTDRFIVEWDCSAECVPVAREDGNHTDDASLPLLDPVSNGTPTLADVGSEARVRVQIPVDVQPILQLQPALAARWRDITRRALSERMASGYRVSGFVRPTNPDDLPYYILSRTAR